MWLLFVVGLIPLVVGSIYYHPKVAGTAWMKANGFELKDLEGGNMARIFGLAYLLSVVLAFTLLPIVIHQVGFFGIMIEVHGSEAATTVPAYRDFMAQYGEVSRTFKHGAFHGMMTGLLLAGSIIGINALFERRSFKYWLIHTVYWAISLALMGGVLARYMDFLPS